MGLSKSLNTMNAAVATRELQKQTKLARQGAPTGDLQGLLTELIAEVKKGNLIAWAALTPEQRAEFHSWSQP